MTFSSRYLVAANLLLLALVAYSAASMVGKTVAARFVAEPKVHLSNPPDPIPAPPAKPLAHYALVYERDFFNSARPTPAVAPEPAPPPPSPLRVTLAGVAVKGPGRSFCVIADARQKQQLYRVGETIEGTDATVKAVEWGRCILDRNGKEEVLELTAKKSTAVPRSPAVRTGSMRGVYRPAPESIQRVSDTEYVIERDEVDRALENMNQLFTQIRAVPHFEGGKAIGFRLFAIRHGSIFDRIGLRNGDILQRVNGVTLDDPTRALAMLEELRNESQLTVEIIRNRQPQTLTYQVR